MSSVPTRRPRKGRYKAYLRNGVVCSSLQDVQDVPPNSVNAAERRDAEASDSVGNQLDKNVSAIATKSPILMDDCSCASTQGTKKGRYKNYLRTSDSAECSTVAQNEALPHNSVDVRASNLGGDCGISHATALPTSINASSPEPTERLNRRRYKNYLRFSENPSSSVAAHDESCSSKSALNISSNLSTLCDGPDSPSTGSFDFPIPRSETDYQSSVSEVPISCRDEFSVSNAVNASVHDLPVDLNHEQVNGTVHHPVGPQILGSQQHLNEGTVDETVELLDALGSPQMDLESFPIENSDESMDAGVDEPTINIADKLGVNPDLFQKYNLDEPLFPGCCTSKFETLLMVVHYSMRHGLTNVAMVDLLKMINIIVGDNAIPATKHNIHKLFDSGIKFKYHYYCSVCKTYIGNEEEAAKISKCPNVPCSKTFSLAKRNDGCYFVTIPIASQIQQLLQEEGIFDKIIDMEKREQNESYLLDIFDGLIYKQLVEDGIIDPAKCFTITCNSDGSPVFKSCKNSLWPIQFRLNELIPSERFSAQRTLLAGLWFGTSEPCMNTFFIPFLEEATKLADEGVTFIDATSGEEKCVKIFTIGCISDTVAKAQLQNLKQFNGEYGCAYCLHPGEKAGESNNKKYPPGEYKQRTNKQCRKDMLTAARTNEAVHGVKGLGPFFAIPYFDVVWGLSCDYMHACLLGVTKFLHHLWFDSSNHEEEFYQGPSKLLRVDKRLLSLRPPSNISRLPRSLSEATHWKANEWRSYLLYYSFLCLDGIIEDVYLEHYSLFISALYLLLQDKISYTDLRQADKYLQEFVERFFVLYGKENMRFNVHLLTHLARNVAKWGPLWTTSAFSLETGNGLLVLLVKGTRMVIQQIMSKRLLYSSINIVTSKYQSMSDSKALDYCDEIMSFSRLKKAINCNSAVVVGKFRLRKLTNNEIRILESMGMTGIKLVKSCPKIIYNGKVHALDKKITHNKQTRFNDSIVRLKNGYYCQLHRFFQHPFNSDSLLFFGKRLKLSLNSCNFHWAMKGPVCLYHIKPCDVYAFEEMSVFKVSDIEAKSILLKVGERLYISDFPNTFEKD